MKIPRPLNTQKMQWYRTAEAFFERKSRGSYPIILRLVFILIAIKFQSERRRLLHIENLYLDRRLLALRGEASGRSSELRSVGNSPRCDRSSLQEMRS